MPVIRVSQINRYVASVLRGDKNLQNIVVRGEISDFVRNLKSGHCYFSLKEGECTVRAVMFKRTAAGLKFQPENGMEVLLLCSVGFYEKGGVCQLCVNDIVPEGAGKQHLLLEQLKKKLAQEGIFSEEHKRSLPKNPRKIGVVTSLSGAAVRDIINVLTRRYPLCEIYAVNTVVQGEDAPVSICRGISRAENAGCDVVIVGRGGGSSEDLSAFNAESVAYAVYNCKVPVISAVGHETDYTVTDLAADVRAATPSAAAELAAPDIKQFYSEISSFETRLETAVSQALSRREKDFEVLEKALSAKSPQKRLEMMNQRLENLSDRNIRAFERYIEKAENTLCGNMVSLDALSPLKVMARGYSLAYKGDILIKDSAVLKENDSIELHFGKGSAEAVVTAVSPKK